MKYFIDFEATQFRGSIISIGIVNENGDGYRTYVKPLRDTLTPRITEITGITKADLADAPDTIEAFQNLYNWVLEHEVESENGWMPEWYCWGSEDLNFARTAFKDCMESATARTVLGDICGGMVDFCNKFCGRYNITHRGLLRVVKIFNPNAEQSHDALDDALLLREIWLNYNIRTDKEIKKLVTNSNLIAPLTNIPYPHWRHGNLPIGTICVLSRKRNVLRTFRTYTEAAEWLKNNKDICVKETINEIATKIAAAAEQGQVYNTIRWRVIKE